MFSVKKKKFVGGGKRWGQSKVKLLTENIVVWYSIYILYIYIVGQSHSSTLLGDFLSSKPVTEDPELAASGWGYPCALLRQ